MMIKEYWWAGEEGKALKSLRWARPMSGQRADILSWLRRQEEKAGRASLVENADATECGQDNDGFSTREGGEAE